ncbi:MAG: hypothetical protein H6742_13275 [Alphaproteobacteria bacterium]|nr:hypothetical protein [Alphaproteobacteria bacterium]
MAQFGDFIARLFGGGGTRGLSGDADRVLHDEPALEYFNARLRRHAFADDFIEDPDVLWDGGEQGGAGLQAHLKNSEYADNIGFTDVLVVVNSDDWHRHIANVRENWVTRAGSLLKARLWEHCEENDLHQVFPQRDFAVKLIEDGGHEMQGARLGLQPGQVVTGLLPNLYLRPGPASKAVISVLVNIPGAWEGYQEVGRLYSDQVQFTLGSHWLDNFCHPGFKVPALYRLQQYADGSFVHIVNPDAEQRYRISSQETNEGPAVLTLAADSGEPIAYMVLAIVEEPSALTQMELRPDAGGDETELMPKESVGDIMESVDVEDDDDHRATEIHMPPPPANPDDEATEAVSTSEPMYLPPPPAKHDAAAKQDPPPAPVRPPPPPGIDDGPLGEISRPGIRLDGIKASSTRTFHHGGNRTVIPAEVDERILTLRERGVLFQRVHFAKFMDGYDVYLGHEGEVGTTIRDRAGTFEIRGLDVTFVPHVDGITVDGRRAAPSQRIELVGRRMLEIGRQQLEFRDMRGTDAEGWPYLGEIRRTGGAAHMVFGGAYKVGRDRRCKVRLPDEPSNANIVWRPEMSQGGSIRSRNGEIPKSRFYTDSIMVASEHAEIRLDTEPVIRSLARHCYTFVRRGTDIFSLHPTEGRPGPRNLDLQPGDEVLVGNQVFAVDYPPADGPRMLPSDDGYASRAPSISPEQLAEAAVSVDKPAGSPLQGAELPPAAGLGEGGKPPMLPQFTRDGPDSFQGIDPAEPGVARLGAAGMDPDPATEEQPKADTPAVGSYEDATSPLDLPDPSRTPPPVSFKTLDQDSFSDFQKELGLVADPRLGVLRTEASTPSEVPAEEPARAIEPVDRPEPTGDSDVVCVDEDAWQLELARPVSFRLQGFMVTGELVIGNHTGADVVIPENRGIEGQLFAACDYFELFVRGRRGHVALLTPDEARLTEAGDETERTEDLATARMEIVRRAPDGEEDFRVVLAIDRVRGLPDPRAQLLKLDDDDPMVEALFTRGLPLRQDHRLTLSTLSCDAHYDGDRVRLTRYLSDYRRPDGSFRPFFVERAGGGWQTAPEDGSEILLAPGDRVLVDNALFELT